MVLKPQDVYVLLKLVAAGGCRPPYSQLAAELSMSPSEVHACVEASPDKRAAPWTSLEDRPNISALEEFLLHGLKYVFPAERGEMSRGVATAYGAEPLRSLIAETDEPIPVWPHAEGHQQGVSLTPLYKTAPDAALRDESFHQL
ncbi:MAG: hypothetical protein R2724_27285 [Bryobacterales bacterium]